VNSAGGLLDHDLRSLSYTVFIDAFVRGGAMVVRRRHVPRLERWQVAEKGDSAADELSFFSISVSFLT
jgi:hypothetical protein